ncbi:uncharacterized protein LOC116617322 [Nematostella vectensis]|uniref:uncharacterized protein LOC116617322 n=1 Tax=Nematostella vectensis TaxID=45351 RepID=UPI00138FA2E4|nr:uncharacterized protein LOC116617322 [Nematostella vectensis]
MGSLLLGLFCISVLDLAYSQTTLRQVETLYNRYFHRAHGDGTYYGKYPTGKGACTLDPLAPLANQPGWIRVAAGAPNYQSSLGCGMCVEIDGKGEGLGLDPIKGRRKAIIHDLCVGCVEDGSMDLYVKGDGRWKINLVAIDCPSLPGPAGDIQFRFQGSNPWYIKLQIRNTVVPAAGVEALVGGRYHCLKRVSDNFFVGMGLGQFYFPLRVRLTSISGQQVETFVPEMKDDVSFPSGVRFGGIKVGAGPSSIVCFGQGDRAPYPPGGMAPGLAPTSGGINTPFPTQPPPEPTTVPPPNPTTISQGSGGTVGDGFCAGKTSGVPLADPSDCHGFIICSLGKVNKFTCGPVLKFNPKANGCDFPQNVQC